MLLEGTQKEKILADAGVELRFGVSALGTGVAGPWWAMSPYEMQQGLGEVQRMWILAFPAHPLCCCAKEKKKQTKKTRREWETRN